MSSLNVPPNSSCFGFYNDASGQSHSVQMPQQEEDLQPEVRQEKKEMDALLSQAMQNLTLEEQRKQQEILHGIDDTVEDSTMVNRALQDLDVKLTSIKHDSMYEVAERINPEYVRAKDFRVMFLRANEYDPDASADQMLRFFESKFQLFGIEKLVEDITLADLNEDDITRLKMGLIQLAGRDSAGRLVIVHFGGQMDPGELESWLRVQYFVKMSALEEEETQLRGIVTIWCAVGDFKAPSSNGKAAGEILKAGKALPQKRSAIHICTDEVRQYMLFNVLVKLIQNRLRMRVRVNFGSPMECQYQLSTFGIHPRSLPLYANGKMDLTPHLNWVQSCTMEGTKAVNVVTPPPTRNDVLFTGGKRINHLGNQVFQSLIQRYAPVYDDERNDDERRQIVAAISEKIHESGGRFLQRQQGAVTGPSWKEVTIDEVRKKIMQAFRNRRCRAEACRRKAEHNSLGTLVAGEPLPNDVVFGKKGSQRNPGTELLHRLIKERFEEYESLGRGVKMELVETIMQTIEEQGGRFLLPAGKDVDRWLELSHADVRDRISKTFRNYRRPLKGK